MGAIGQKAAKKKHRSSSLVPLAGLPRRDAQGMRDVGSRSSPTGGKEMRFPFAFGLGGKNKKNKKPNRLEIGLVGGMNRAWAFCIAVDGQLRGDAEIPKSSLRVRGCDSVSPSPVPSASPGLFGLDRSPPRWGDAEGNCLPRGVIKTTFLWVSQAGRGFFGVGFVFFF